MPGPGDVIMKRQSLFIPITCQPERLIQLNAMIAKLHGTVGAYSWDASLLCQVREGFLEKMMFKLRPEE